MVVLYSAWPHYLKNGFGKIPNDALIILQAFGKQEDKIATAISYRYIYEAYDFQKRYDYAKAREWLRKGQQKYPADKSLAFYDASLSILEEKFVEARAALRALLSTLKESDPYFYLTLNNLAFANIMQRQSEFIEEADNFSQKAFEKFPSYAPFKGTRGMMLFELGKAAEGIQLLEEAQWLSQDKQGKALTACLLGMAYLRNRRISDGQKLFNMARRWDSRCFLLKHEQLELNQLD
jgi:predicted Zn-dependent protease